MEFGKKAFLTHAWGYQEQMRVVNLQLICDDRAFLLMYQLFLNSKLG